jgi:hypothetical protein
MEDAESAFRKWRGQIKSVPSSDLVPKYVQYHTFLGHELTDEDVIRLNTGKAAFCSFGIAIWEDDTGKYETDNALCIKTEGNGVWNWHVEPQHNHETKLGM